MAFALGMFSCSQASTVKFRCSQRIEVTLNMSRNFANVKMY